MTFVLLAAFALSLSASDFYVAPAGDDSSPGTLDAPFATLERAIARVAPVVFRAEIFVEPDQVYLVLSGRAVATRSRLAAVNLLAEGELLTPIYAGAQAGRPAFDQVKAPLSDSLAWSGHVEVSLTVDGAAAKPTQGNLSGAMPRP